MPEFKKIRTEEELTVSALAILDLAMSGRFGKRTTMFPLYSGGYDSFCAVWLASQHPKFGGVVYHIDTGIGSEATRRHVEKVCKSEKWSLRVLKSPSTYEKFVSNFGFPGPGAHQWVYNQLKDRCIRVLERETMGKVVLVTGCRSQESSRRMGHTQPIKVGEKSKKTGKVSCRRRLWVAPCYDWSSSEQKFFMNRIGFDPNPIKESPLGMSGECFCGAFARPYELEMIRQVCPDVAEKIDSLTKKIACSDITEKNKTWGYRQKSEQELVETGPMCSSCDAKAAAAGVKFKR